MSRVRVSSPALENRSRIDIYDYPLNLDTSRYALDYAGGRLRVENDRLRQEVVLLKEESLIKDARSQRIDPHKRPHYPPTERMAIPKLPAARSSSQQKTADRFQITAATIALWMKCLDEVGPDALVQLNEPVNKFELRWGRVYSDAERPFKYER